MPRKTVLKRKARANAKTRRTKRMTTRRRMGGVCDPSAKYRDYNHCIASGCPETNCEKYKRLLAEQLVSSVNKINDTRKIESDAIDLLLRVAKNEQIKPFMRHDDKDSFNAFVSRHLSTTPIVNIMSMRPIDLARSFEQYNFNSFPHEAKHTVSSAMRKAEVNRLESLMPQLLENYDASVVGHRRD